MKRRTHLDPHLTLSIVLTGLAALLISSCTHSPPLIPGRPHHLVFMVFDAMRPDYIDRFDLRNFKRLRSISATYPNAELGYLGAETVVGHLVLSTGRAPGALPWQDDVWIDRKGQIGAPDAFYTLPDLTIDQFTTLMKTVPQEEFLQLQIKNQIPGKIFAVGEKNYAAVIFGSQFADSIVTLKKANGYCTPDGRNLPSYLLETDRYSLNCQDTYGTRDTFYPYDGDHYVPGHDPSHLGGDVWTADAALEIMRREPWSTMLLTFGAIDKVSHMLGEEDGKSPIHIETEYTLERVAQIADQQLGRILDYLEQNHLMEDTVIALTADHGGQTNSHYLGNGVSAKWTNGNKHARSSDWIRHFSHFPFVEHTFQDSAIRIWLKQTQPGDPTLLVRALAQVPGVIEVYHLRHQANGWDYRKVYWRLNGLSPSARQWAETQNQQIVDAMACEGAPDIIALMANGYGFDLLGDHGGAQEKIQRVPLMIAAPHLTPEQRLWPVRHMEIKGLILEQLGLTPLSTSPNPHHN